MNTIREPNPYLYILMRQDLDSLNPGKKVAQGAHAANQFVFEFKRDSEKPSYPARMLGLFDQWQSSTPQGFGVTICLGIDGNKLPMVIGAAKKMNLPAGVTHDPSYPVTDGLVTHLIPLDTCGYVFGDKDDLVALLGQFNLLP